MLDKRRIDNAWRASEDPEVCTVIRTLEDERNRAAADAVFWRELVALDVGIITACIAGLAAVRDYQRDAIRDYEPPASVLAPPSSPEGTD